MTKVNTDPVNRLLVVEDYYGFDYCDDLMYTISRLDIGHNRTIRYWMAQELYILLTEGPDVLKKHREDNNWWG